MVIGGNDDPFGNSPYFKTVELVSLDPTNNPVPECLENISDIPISGGVSFASVGMSRGNKKLMQFSNSVFNSHS